MAISGGPRAVLHLSAGGIVSPARAWGHTSPPPSCTRSVAPARSGWSGYRRSALWSGNPRLGDTHTHTQQENRTLKRAQRLVFSQDIYIKCHVSAQLRPRTEQQFITTLYRLYMLCSRLLPQLLRLRHVAPGVIKLNGSVPCASKGNTIIAFIVPAEGLPGTR